MQPDRMAELYAFAERYTRAWCSQDAASVASFFEPDGSLTINDGTPSVGTAGITRAAQAFMTDFPDLKVSMNALEEAKGESYNAECPSCHLRYTVKDGQVAECVGRGA